MLGSEFQIQSHTGLYHSGFLLENHFFLVIQILEVAINNLEILTFPYPHNHPIYFKLLLGIQLLQYHFNSQHSPLQ